MSAAASTAAAPAAIGASRIHRILLWGPLLAVCALASALTLWVSFGLLRLAAPVDPWEAAITVEAARVAGGDAGYPAPEPGQATHLYGPLLQYLIAPVFAWTGPDNRVVRLVSLAAAAASIALLLSLAGGWRRGPLAAVHASLFVAVDAHSAGYFTIGKPDSLAFALALAALLVHARALGLLRADRAAGAHDAAGPATVRVAGGVLLASVLVVACFFAKQNLAGLAAIIPGGYLLACLLRRERWSAQRLLLTLVPLAALGAAVLALRAAAPYAYAYLILLPASYAIPPFAVLHWMSWGLKALPLAAVVLAAILLEARPGGRFVLRRADCYIASALGGALLLCSVSAAKYGGTVNSMLAFLMLLAAALVHYTERLQWSAALAAQAAATPWRAAALGLGGAVVLAASLFPGDLLRIWGLQPNRHSAAWHEAVAQTRTLPALPVVSPEDPTLLLGAGRPAGFNVYLEYDLAHLAQSRGAPFPRAQLESAFLAARYVWEVKPRPALWGSLNWLDPTMLARLGFNRAWENDAYVLWQRAGPD